MKADMLVSHIFSPGSFKTARHAYDVTAHPEMTKYLMRHDKKIGHKIHYQYDCFGEVVSINDDGSIVVYDYYSATGIMMSPDRFKVGDYVKGGYRRKKPIWLTLIPVALIVLALFRYLWGMAQ